MATNATGTTGYRLAGKSVERLDLNRAQITGRIELGEYSSATGATAVSPDETTVAALTRS